MIDPLEFFVKNRSSTFLKTRLSHSNWARNLCFYFFLNFCLQFNWVAELSILYPHCVAINKHTIFIWKCYLFEDNKYYCFCSIFSQIYLNPIHFNTKNNHILSFPKPQASFVNYIPKMPVGMHCAALLKQRYLNNFTRLLFHFHVHYNKWTWNMLVEPEKKIKNCKSLTQQAGLFLV